MTVQVKKCNNLAVQKQNKSRMEFLPEEIEKYVEQHTEKEPELLKKLNRETWQKVLIPRMLSGHLQGRILSMFSKIIAPESVLEIGTYTGYSALCLAEGLQSGGELHTIDINEELKDIQDKYFNASGYRQQIIQHIGDALEIVPGLDKTWDLVFVDADKHNYINYYEMVLPKMRQGGIIIFDNVLWSGKVVGEIDENDHDTNTLHRLNQLLVEDDRVENILFPVRDGLMVARKK